MIARLNSRRFRRLTAARAAFRAFTLIELLVVIAIIAVLAALLLPAARGTLVAARSFKCQAAQRGVAFDFQVFADESLHGNRGNDEQLGGGRFRLETFIESQYRVDEFWGWGTAMQHALPDLNGNDLMRCPEVEGNIIVMRNSTCFNGAVQPPQHVSFGFNARLYQGEVNGQLRTHLPLTPRLMDSPEGVPLLWDVDGARAVEVSDSANPLLTAPDLGSPYFERMWFPGVRHAGRMNAAFLDGSVRDTRDPLAENEWRWDFAPMH